MMMNNKSSNTVTPDSKVSWKEEIDDYVVRRSSIDDSEPRHGQYSDNRSKEAINNTNNTSKKKSVRFSNATMYRLHSTPPASEMTTKEKHIIWYNSNEYDKFKFDAAESADVKILRLDDDDIMLPGGKHPNKVGRGHRFVMMGDFDGKMPDRNPHPTGRTKESVGGNNADAPTAAGGTALNNNNDATTGGLDTGDGKRYYNENEYDDRAKDGEVVCKRGLGYHFSKSRKRSRVVTRQVVVAWQESLRDATTGQVCSPAIAAIDKIAKKEASKSQMMLALVSTKCSRASVEEARWRGNVDYRVAYPERRRHILPNSKRGAPLPMMEACSLSDKMKRRNCVVGFAPMENAVSGRKRRRTAVNNSNVGCGGDNREELSPATIGALSGVLELNGVLRGRGVGFA